MSGRMHRRGSESDTEYKNVATLELPPPFGGKCPRLVPAQMRAKWANSRSRAGVTPIDSRTVAGTWTRGAHHDVCANVKGGATGER
jgi:hypothetical protein